MHTFTTEYSATSTNAIRLTSSMNPIKGHNDKLRQRKPSLRDVYLPPIHKQFVQTPMANLQTAKSWSSSTKELIAQEWENLQRIKKRGTLAPKYNVLPPINHGKKSLFNNGESLHDSNDIGRNKNGHLSKPVIETAGQLQRVLHLNECEDESSEASIKELPRVKRNSRRRKKNNQQNEESAGEKQAPTTLSTSAATKQIRNERKIKEKSVQFPHIQTKCEKNEKKTGGSPSPYPLPKVPSPIHMRGKDLERLEQKYSEEMIEWIRYKGRRAAICYEMDPLFRELTSIIKYNLLVQHLEDIWMC